MLKIRKFTESDAKQVGILIADTYGGFNLPEMTPEKRQSMLGPFAFARSSAPEHREAIVSAIKAPSVWVAEQDGEIVGVLRGGRTDTKGRTVLPVCLSAGSITVRALGGRWSSASNKSTSRKVWAYSSYLPHCMPSHSISAWAIKSLRGCGQ